MQTRGLRRTLSGGFKEVTRSDKIKNKRETAALLLTAGEGDSTAEREERMLGPRQEVNGPESQFARKGKWTKEPVKGKREK